MSSKIDSLFEEIVKFEERANEHREKLLEAKHKVQDREKELHELREENECLVGHLVVKTDTLSEHEAKLVCLGIREKTLTTQVQKMVEEGELLSKKINDEHNKKVELRRSFCDMASHFTDKYGILSDWAWVLRQRKSQLKTVALTQEIKDLKAAMEKSQAVFERVLSLSDTLKSKRQARDEMLQEVEVIKQKQEIEEQEIRNLDRHIIELEVAPQKAPEFKRLRFEISRLHRTKADANRERQRWTQHKMERERQQSHNPWFLTQKGGSSGGGVQRNDGQTE